MGKSIGIFSGKGGVGKTVTAIGLASAINGFGRDVLVIDANITSPNMFTYLGSPHAPVTLNDVIRGHKKIDQAVQVHSSGIKTIYSSISFHDIKKTDFKRLGEAVREASKLAEFVIVDGAPGQTDESVEAIRGVDEILVVANPDLVSVTDALRIIQVADELKVPVTGVVLTRVTKAGHEMDTQNVEHMTGHKVIATIPEDQTVKLAAKLRSSVTYAYPDSAVSVSYKKLAAQLLGQRYVPSLKGRDEAGVFTSLFERFKK
jgi:MinD-like ATPase involved in chromosome partitioning or flagellar assembly